MYALCIMYNLNNNQILVCRIDGYLIGDGLAEGPCGAGKVCHADGLCRNKGLFI